ncbi:chromate efflux transporter [Desertivirga brevis]|uniref:chromate efflux transporter n=1 Tax=Desertivirga brevis TaxID=2810310 RepID=UPI001F5FF645|nr:chromate efflux transporter [Pedobacter sp. SYSU D00873]
MKTFTTNLKEVIFLFLRLGFTAFGGPAAHIAMMEWEVVKKKAWMTEEHFLDLLGATNLIPGPNSTEMTMHIGNARAGWKGLVAAGLCFILPAVFITGILAHLYKEYGTLPQVAGFVYGIKPAVLAVIVSLMFSLSRKAIKTVEAGVIGVLAACLALAGLNEIYVLFGAGALGILLNLYKEKKAISFVPLLWLPAIKPVSSDTFSNYKLLLIFLKIGAILYGSGYVLFAFLDAELVKRGLISHQTLVDAIAVGQFTPGPVFSSATFIGWQVGGIGGAVAATIGIFLPSFFFVSLLNPLIPKLRRSKLMSGFLDAVNVASIGLILAVCIEMGKASLVDWRTIVIVFLSFVVNLLFPKLNTAFIVMGGSIIGRLLLFFN